MVPVELTKDVLNYLEKQHELLTKALRAELQKLRKLEVEQEMLMRKLYELMSTQRQNNKKMEETQNVSQGKEIVEVENDASSSSNNIKAKK